MDKIFVAFDDQDQGRIRLVGPFATREGAELWISEAESIASRDHRLEKRVSFEITEEIEDPESTLSLINGYLRDWQSIG
jgi:hypothetical protein